MQKTVIIIGSSNNDGKTKSIIDFIVKRTSLPVINLNDFNISHFDYQHQNSDDDYIPLMEKIIENYDTLIFATPVYWYAMSGILKVFFDRFTDLLTIRKDLGKKLKDKNMAVITTSTGDHLGDQFWLPFSKTADYFQMNFLWGYHFIEEGDNLDDLLNLVKNIK